MKTSPFVSFGIAVVAALLFAGCFKIDVKIDAKVVKYIQNLREALAASYQQEDVDVSISNGSTLSVVLLNSRYIELPEPERHKKEK